MRKHIAVDELDSLVQGIVQWYRWLNSEPPNVDSAFKLRTHLRKFYFDRHCSEVAVDSMENLTWFVERGSQVLEDEKSIKLNGGEGALEQKEGSLDGLQQLQTAIENWYAWLSSSPVSLFLAEDAARMKGPVGYFHKANEWLSRTTIINADWFFEEGSEIVMNRWLEGDFDSYE